MNCLIFCEYSTVWNKVSRVTEVQKDEKAAQELGINSIPHFIIDNKYVVSGAQSREYFLSVLKQAYSGN